MSAAWGSVVVGLLDLAMLVERRDRLQYAQVAVGEAADDGRIEGSGNDRQATGNTSS